MERSLRTGVRAVLAAGMLALGGARARAEEPPTPEAADGDATRAAAAAATEPAAVDASQSDEPRVPAAAHEGTRRLTLEDCLEIARRANLEILTKERSLSKRDLDVSSARAAFLPTLSFSGSSDRKIDDSSKRLSLSQSLPWGTEIDASVHDSDSDGTDSTRSVTISQPLLGGGWAAESLADLRGAHLAREAERARHERLLADITYRVKSRYYEVQEQLATIKVREAAVRGAKLLLEGVALKRKMQMVTLLDYSDARIQLLDREAELESTRARLQDSLDDLKELLYLPLEDEIEVIPVALELDKEIVVDRDKRTVSVVEALQGERPRTRLIFASAERDDEATVTGRALSQRPDLRAATLDLDSKDIEVRRKSIQRLWTLDVSATHSTRGTGSAFNETFVSEDGEWELGLTATWPLGRVARRAAYGRALLDYEIEETALEQKTIGVRKEVRRILRRLQESEKNILTYAEKIGAAALAVEAAEIQQEKVEAITDRRTKLLNAQTSFISSLLDYKKKLAELELAEGKPPFADSPQGEESSEKKAGQPPAE